MKVELLRELFFHILNGAAVRIGGAIKRIGSAPGAKYSLPTCQLEKSHNYLALITVITSAML